MKPDYPKAHFNLGIALARKWQLDEAIAADREVIRCKPGSPDAHLNLGVALVNQGKFTQALAPLRRAHELGSLAKDWPYLSAAAQEVNRCERLIDLDRRLPQILRGEEQPRDAAQQLDLAEVCRYKKLHAAAVRFYAAAFAAAPKVANNLPRAVRYQAARTAARAAAGEGVDAAKLDPEERSRIRR